MNIERLVEFVGNHPILIGAFIVSVVIIITAQLRRSRGNAVEAHELVRLMNQEDAQVIDVRDEKSFNGGHIIDAKNIVVAKIDDDFSSLKLNTHKPVVLVCQMGATSSGLVKKFVALGCEEVYSLRDGIYGWEKAKLPLEV